MKRQTLDEELKNYRFRVYVGPIVAEYWSRSNKGGNDTLIGTEHAHVTIRAKDIERASDQCLALLKSWGLAGGRLGDLDLLRIED